ncbi:LysR family transcriptional regulator [Mycoplana sp. MJR14]|uniref:LysR family transcriptional regulator n=1 Tax=Mycoplana sp. MJR14 TaxID=3032583 RepID=UPI0023D9A8C2|nr:LysR family transcriptional regulator [Mycoplana sp. MJR14]MDF1632091.1 LysR family transcriptional regulator [Mycoplana sp. MJR14]
MLDWDDLRYFTALADDGSLSAAARRLKVDHATVARRIAALEEKTGVRLVDRRARRYQLTPEGVRVAEHARRMEVEALAVERSLHPRPGERPVEVSVSAPPVIAVGLIAPRLAAFRKDHPNIRLRLLGHIQTVSLTRREADVAVRLSRPADTTLVVRKAATIRYRLYAAASYLAGRAPADYEFIGFDDSVGEIAQQTWLMEIAGKRPLALRSNDLAIQAAAAAAGLGIAALPEFAAARLGLEEMDASTGAYARDAWLTYHHDLRDSPAIAAAVPFLADCLKQRPAAGL